MVTKSLDWFKGKKTQPNKDIFGNYGHGILNFGIVNVIGFRNK